MFDSFDREITYLRISVTEACNLRCVYCMPAEGIPRRNPGKELSFERIAEVSRAAVALGMTKIRLTGGEPLMRRGIVKLVGMLSRIPGLDHLAMTTNGTFLGRYARGLREAGLSAVNVSLDTLDEARYRFLTRGGRIRDALEGIHSAREQGLTLKINMVVLEDCGEEEIARMRRFCGEIGARLQLINHFDLSREKSDTYRFDRPPPCRHCNRIRLLADGTLKPCLHSDTEIALDPSRIAESLRETILSKPLRGSACTNRAMIRIGG